MDQQVEQLCTDEHIVHNFSAAYSHEQNAVAERKFQTLGDVARSLLLTAGLDAYYWPFAYEHACLLSNVMPTRTYDDSSFSPPHFKLYGTHFDYKKLKVWGCKAYPFIGKGVKKLEDRCLDGFRFVGIDSKSGAFVLLDPDTGDFMLSGMPTFHENLTEYGKIMSDQRIASRNEFFESEVTSDPGVTSDLEVPAKGLKIISHRAFVDSSDKKSREVRAIVQVECTDSIIRWLFLEEFLQSGTSLSIRKHNWTLFTKYITNFLRLGNENDYYPLFAEVKVSPSALKQCKNVQSFVCAWDRDYVDDSGHKCPYTVIGAPGTYDQFDAKLTEIDFGSTIPIFKTVHFTTRTTIIIISLGNSK